MGYNLVCPVPGSARSSRGAWMGTLVLLALGLTGCAQLELPRYVDEQVHRVGTVLHFDPSSTHMVSGGSDGYLARWDLSEGRAVHTWRAHGKGVSGLGYMGGAFISTSLDGTVTRWSPAGERLGGGRADAPITRFAGAVDRFVTGHSDGSVRVWRFPDLEIETQYKLHEAGVSAVAIHHASGWYASAGRDYQVFLWREGQEPVALQRPPSEAWSLVFSPDGRFLYAGGWRRLYRWEIPSGRLVLIDTPHGGRISSIHFVPGSDSLASISRITDSSIHFLDPDTGKSRRQFARQALCGSDVQVSPDGRYLATTGDDGAVRLWRLDEPAPPRGARPIRVSESD
jgi:WD40 repeat protein